MLCDELKSLWVYNRDIDDNCDEEFVNFAKENGYEELVEKKEVNEAIAELKQKLHDAEMQADLAECAVTEYKIDYDKLNGENRRLKRALWLARAERAKWESLYYWCAISNKYKFRLFDKVERKCRAKAEEYK